MWAVAEMDRGKRERAVQRERERERYRERQRETERGAVEVGRNMTDRGGRL